MATIVGKVTVLCDACGTQLLVDPENPLQFSELFMYSYFCTECRETEAHQRVDCSFSIAIKDINPDMIAPLEKEIEMVLQDAKNLERFNDYVITGEEA